MAPLSQPYWESVTDRMKDLLEFIGRQPFNQRFYLAGGTALALQLGHRQSVDLDFFSETDEVTPQTQTEILAHLASLNPTVLERAWGHFLLALQQTQVGFFAYGYPLIQPTVSIANIRLAHPLDIGLMKLDALISRAARKDFYDLYFIAQTTSLEELLALGQQKYRYARDFEVEAVRSLVFFVNAEKDVEPEMLEPVLWETVKDFFRNEAKRLGKQWLA